MALRDEYLVVNGITLCIRAFQITSLAALLDDAPLRGDDRIVPGATGVLPYKRRRTVSVRTLPLFVDGAWDRLDAAVANPRNGLIANLEWLKANLGIALASGDGTVTAVWHRPDGSTKTAAVHVLGLIGVQKTSPATAMTTLDLSIPAGVFA